MDRFKFRVFSKSTQKLLMPDISDYWFDSLGDIIEDEDCILEQCTGLKDTNGKLIYEGDILRYTYDWREEIKPVVFDTISACYGVEICKDFILPFANNLSNIEVIGNIHENPELLKTEVNNDWLYNFR